MKTILITGAGTGIGRDAAFALSKLGHTVIATTETEAQAEALRKEGFKMEIFKLDITSPSDRELIIRRDIDVLINNAGIGETGPISEVPMDRVRQNFEVNVFSALELTQMVLKVMMEKGKGTVIFISSLAGRAPSAFLNPYSMTKFAISGGVAAMREEIHRIAPNVHMCLVEPGAYATGFNQRMLAKKYEWMDESSYFYKIIASLRREDAERFGLLEQKSTKSIAASVIKPK